MLAEKQNKITIEHARNKLGDRGKAMSDKEVLELLNTLRVLCSKTIDGVVTNESNI